MMREIIRLATGSIKQNLKPGLVLWSLALLTVFLYYFYEPSGSFFNFIGELKTEHGKLYAIISTSIFGGIIPFIYLLITGEIRKNIIPELLF